MQFKFEKFNSLKKKIFLKPDIGPGNSKNNTSGRAQISNYFFNRVAGKNREQRLKKREKKVEQLLPA